VLGCLLPAWPHGARQKLRGALRALRRSRPPCRALGGLLGPRLRMWCVQPRRCRQGELITMVFVTRVWSLHKDLFSEDYSEWHVAFVASLE